MATTPFSELEKSPQSPKGTPLTVVLCRRERAVGGLREGWWPTPSTVRAWKSVIVCFSIRPEAPPYLLSPAGPLWENASAHLWK